MTRVFVNRTENFYKTVSSASELMDNELTVSHLFRAGGGGSAFTRSGLSYGETLAKKLGVREGMRILEIGPGLGDVAGGLVKGIEDFHYTFIDISFDVIRNLKKRFGGSCFSFVVGDFMEQRTRERFDLIVCNEVLADFPTIVNMTLYDAKMEEDDKKEYFDAVSLAKLYGLTLPKVSNFNYGAAKFLDKAKDMLAEGGRIFVCEHASAKPTRIPVFGHAEYTIDFGMLEKLADKMKFARVERANLTSLLGVKDAKAIVFYTQPELKMLYDFLKGLGTPVEQKAYAPSEAVEALEKSGVRITRGEDYASYLEKRAKPLTSVTDQFEYLILET